MFNRYHKLFFFLMFTITLLHSNVEVDGYLKIQHAWEDHKEALILIIIMAFVSLYYFIRISRLNRALQLSKCQLEEHEKELERIDLRKINMRNLQELEAELY